MNYNFNNPFFPWTTLAPFLPNGFPANSTTSNPTLGGFTAQHQVPSQQHAPSIVPGFNNDALFPGPRFSAVSGYPFGLNSQFNTACQNGNASFSGDWNYLGHFNTPVTPQQHITLPMNNSVSGNIGSSTVAIPQSISSVSDANNRAVSVNSISHKSSSVSSLPSGSGSDGNSNNDLVDKSKDDITDEIALKVSTLLSNPSIFQDAISHIQSTKHKESSNKRCSG